MHPQFQLIYPHRMIVIWLEYILLAFVIILFVDLVIALILLSRSRVALKELHTTVEDQHGTIKIISTEISAIKVFLCDHIPKKEETLPEFVSKLSPEEKQVVKTEYLGNVNKYTETESPIPFSLPVNRVEVINEKLSEAIGIPMFEQLPLGDVKKRSRRKSN